MTSIKSYLARVLPPRLIMHMQAADHYFRGESEIRVLPQVVPRGKAAIDAGANIGTYSYFLRKYTSQVYAYEPNPELASRLAKLMPTVRVRQVALSNTISELTLKIPVDSMGRLCHELASVAQDFEQQTRDFRVQCITIDSENLNDIGFIKIDVEQHERAVLRGALATIRRCRPVMLVEVYPLKYSLSLAEEFAFVTEENYCAWFEFAGTWYPLPQLIPELHVSPQGFGLPGQFIGNNLLFFPAEHGLASTGPSRPA